MRNFIKKFGNSAIQPLIISLLLLSACRVNTGVPVAVTETALNLHQACDGRFVSHDLPHVTAENVERIGFFLSNGSGLAINDLDLDGDLDIVLGNLLGPNQIFWNMGNFDLQPQTLFEGSTRAIMSVDLNADRFPDLLFTTRNGELHYWENQGDRQFSRSRLPGINNYAGFAYAANAADLDGDDDLDLVTGSYDASLEKITSGLSFRERGFPGVHVYWQTDGHFTPERLADQAQALALDLPDLNMDDRPDILVGNDFDMPDRVWLNAEVGFETATPFAATTMSTMSFDSGDLDNDGRPELFAADMHPIDADPATMAQWEPVMAAMTIDVDEGDPQRMENVLHQATADALFDNVAHSYGIPYSGWSWSAKFGDLDQDGYLDLYVVNGMQALDNFSHLRNDELVEENQIYQNIGGERFSPADWGLNSIRGGRSMSMADLDGDGDLDIIVNNLGTPSQIFENRLCGGDALLVDLSWPKSQNRAAIGAKVVLEIEGVSGKQSRTVKALSGYLSGDAPQLHFGIPKGKKIKRMIVKWPDGKLSIIKRPESNQKYHIERLVN